MAHTHTTQVARMDISAALHGPEMAGTWYVVVCQGCDLINTLRSRDKAEASKLAAQHTQAGE